jgi:hypothetical protein
MDTRDQALQLFGCADAGADKINAKGYWEFRDTMNSWLIRQSVCIGTQGGTFRIPDLTNWS